MKNLSEYGKEIHEAGERTADKAARLVDELEMYPGDMAADYVWVEQRNEFEIDAVWWHTVQWAVWPEHHPLAQE